MNADFADLLDGNTSHSAAFRTRFDNLQTSQHPDVVSVCCSDSRVLQDHIWDNDEPGRVFTCGNIGNRVVQPTDSGAVVSGDVLYPVEHTGTEIVVVVGHTGCGAVTATYDALTTGISEPPGIEHCLDILKPSLEPGIEALPADLSREQTINRLVEYNVDRQVDCLTDSPDIPARVDVIGAVYDFQDVYSGQRGEIHVINVDGERSVSQLRRAHPEIESRIERIWEY